MAAGISAATDQDMNDKSLVNIVKTIESKIKTRVYSNKYAIISYVYENRQCSPSDVAGHCLFSASTFYDALKDLVASGILLAEGPGADRRTRRYRLDPILRGFLDKRHQYIAHWFRQRLKTDQSVSIAGFTDHIRAIEQRFGIRYYSSEFEVIVFLYERVQASSGELFENSAAASTSFYYALRKLSEMGVVHCKQDDGDKRLKTYSLPEVIRNSLDDAHRKIIDCGLLRAAQGMP